MSRDRDEYAGIKNCVQCKCSKMWFVSIPISHSTQSPSFVYLYLQFYQNKDSSSCITFCANADSPYRSQALKILSNLSKSSGKNILNEADAVTTACYLITAQELTTQLNESEERHCVCVICFLADDACNRAKIRKSGAFKRLLELAKNTTSDSLLTMVSISCHFIVYANLFELSFSFSTFFIDLDWSATFSLWQYEHRFDDSNGIGAYVDKTFGIEYKRLDRVAQ